MYIDVKFGLQLWYIDVEFGLQLWYIDVEFGLQLWYIDVEFGLQLWYIDVEFGFIQWNWKIIAKNVEILRNKHGIFILNTAIFSHGKKFD